MNYKDQIKSPLWQEKRLRIMERDGFCCKVCGKKDNTLNVHHLYYTPNTAIWDYDSEALVTLCKQHHESIHELSKLAGIIAFKILTGSDVFDIVEMRERIGRFK